MTKVDRAKMEKRFNLDERATLQNRNSMMDFCAREVDRAIRTERKAQRDTEEIWASHRRRADEQMIERAKGLGRKMILRRNDNGKP